MAFIIAGTGLLFGFIKYLDYMGFQVKIPGLRIRLARKTRVRTKRQRSSRNTSLQSQKPGNACYTRTFLWEG